MPLKAAIDTSRDRIPFHYSHFSSAVASSSTPSSPKRRKLSHPTDHTSMGSVANDVRLQPHYLHLTPQEHDLRELLLNVAEYVNRSRPSTPIPELRNGMTHEQEKRPLILRFAGGWVRDKLLGVASHDVDVALSNMTGERFGEYMLTYLRDYGLENMEDLGAYGLKAMHKIKANPEKSKHLETGTTKIFGMDVDFVNLRKETYTEETRNPQMEFGTPEEDALRRDATINALFYNVHTACIEDFTGRGLQDMERKVMRTPLDPYQTFKDDPLRVMRLIRFASRLDYDIDEAAQESMSDTDIQEAFTSKISRERVGIELRKMLRGPRPWRALRYIHDLNLYNVVFVNPKKLQHYQSMKLTNTFFADADSENVDANVVNLERAYLATQELLEADNDEGQKLRTLLVTNKEHEFHCWFMASLAPWTVVGTIPNNGSAKATVSAASTVARRAIDATNDECAIIDNAVKNVKEIGEFNSLVTKRRRDGHLSPEEASSLSRSNLGMAIRRWGQHWRSQVVLSLLHDALEVEDASGRAEVFQRYATFMLLLEELDLLEAPSLEPVVSGTDLMKAVGAKAGMWVQTAKDIAMRWQLEHPDDANAEGAIEEVLRRRNELPIGVEPSSKKKKQPKSKKQSNK